ncbi:hypothetical protein AJ79_06351 [Helicocarpus griseus UAMH5409]|uniref:Receptor L-domain domain-containing protein n=1 Tax=Helicocarpus griseus UAMH5409 TaxID=1447875 RepID=A0A2B7XEA1_9EURO|nr:hypothetical protein AJ79_06351 [Helicocarpus griseus UAMH5409]
MDFLGIWLSLTLITTGLPLGILAQECHTNTTDLSLSPEQTLLTVASQNDLDPLLNGCTTVVGNIRISQDYSGPFALNGITDFPGKIYTSPRHSLNELTSFEMLDVVNLGGLWLDNVADAFLPNVEEVESVSLKSSPGGEVDLGRLMNAGAVTLQGAWSRVNLKSLRNVTKGGLHVSSKRDSDTRLVGDSIAIDLPALESASYINAIGNISRLSMPHLETIGVAELQGDYGSGLNMDITGSSLEVELPAVRTIYNSFCAKGDVSRLNLNSLEKTNAEVRVETNIPVDIYSAVKSVSSVDLRGKIKTIDFPNLTEASQFNIISDLAVPCTNSLNKLYEAKYGSDSKPTWCTSQPNLPRTDSVYLSRRSTVPGGTSTEPVLSTGSLIGIIIGCILAGILAIASIYTSCHRRAEERKKSRQATELTNTSRQGQLSRQLNSGSREAPPAPYRQREPLSSPAPPYIRGV